MIEPSGNQTQEVRQMQEAAKEIGKLAEDVLKNVERIGAIIHVNRAKYGKRFMELLPELMPPSFWITCEGVHLGIIDSRVALIPDARGRLLRSLSKKDQTTILDEGIEVNGRKIPINDIPITTLSKMLNVGHVTDGGRFVLSDPEPRYTVKDSVLIVNKKSEFTRDDLINILGDMQ